MLRKITVFLIPLAACLCPLTAQACDVPVFRYALERWPAERYLLTAYGPDSLSPQQKQALAFCRNLSSRPDNPANFDLVVSGAPPGEAPSFQLTCPSVAGRPVDIWSGGITEQNAGRIADSPARQEIAARLVDGQSAVWVLLESGDRGRDEAAGRLLESELAALERSLTLPEAVTGGGGRDLPQLRVDFSLIRVSRTDPAEEVLVRMLCSSEPDLGDYSAWPIAFPVFGRGRVLYALVGAGITQENIRRACAFLVGPCACEIKDLSPGMDLLIAADWERAVQASWVDRVDPSGLASLAGMAGEFSAGREYSAARERRLSGPVIGALAALAVALSVVGAFTFRIIRSSGRREK